MRVQEHVSHDMIKIIPMSGLLQAFSYKGLRSGQKLQQNDHSKRHLNKKDDQDDEADCSLRYYDICVLCPDYG